jgi:transglutaminase-like putative cysteine protease
MHLTISHRTAYTYSEPARSLIQLLRMTPVSFAGQTVLDWQVDVDCDARLRRGRDGYGNIVHMLYVDRPLEHFSLTVSGTVLTENQAGVVSGLPYDLPPQVFLRGTQQSEAGTAIGALADEIQGAGGGRIDFLHRLNAILHQRMRFDTAATEVDTTGEQALAAGHGVCQDFAHVFSAACRLLGIPARYVSGQLYQRSGDHIQEAAHAWAEAWVDELGWVGFDPANGISPDDAYVRVACGLDYRDAAPVAGTRSGGGSETLTVEVQVREVQGQGQWQSQG